MTERRERAVIYPGTFDPITKGHEELIHRALGTFDRVVVLIAHSKKKAPLFSPDERKALIEESFRGEKRIDVDISDGLLVEYARKRNIQAILRGLRAVSDFEYEFQMALINRRMWPDLETFFLMASDHFFFVNSTLIKEVCSHGGDISSMVSPHVERALRKKL